MAEAYSLSPEDILSRLNELVHQDRRATTRIVRAEYALGQLHRLPGFTYQSDREDSYGSLDVLNFLIADSGRMFVPVYEYPSDLLSMFRLVKRDPWLTDPRPPVRIWEEIGPAERGPYGSHLPQPGDRVLITAGNARTVRRCYLDAFLAVCHQQTRQGVMLGREDEFALVQFGAAETAVPVHEKLLYTHDEDVRRRHEPPQSETHQEATGTEGQGVQPDPSGESA